MQFNQLSQWIVRGVLVALGALIFCNRSARSFAMRLAMAVGFVLIAIFWQGKFLLAAAIAAAAVEALRRVRGRCVGIDELLSAVSGDSLGENTPGEAASSARRAGEGKWCWIGLSLFIAGLLFLEVRTPYYFCQDDMLVGVTPALLEFERSIFKGIAAEWTPSVLMGAPMASAGGGLAYPPLHMAYAISRWMLHDEFSLVDVLAIGHLLGIYIAFWMLLRRAGGSGIMSAAGALAMCFSGSMLIMGRSWGIIIQATLWTVLLLLAVLRMERCRVGWKWMLATGLVAGLLFHVGFVQLWAAGMLIAAVAALALWLVGRIPTARLPWLAMAALLGVALAAPLMYQQWLLTRDIVTVVPRADDGIGRGIAAMFLPFPLMTASHPNGWGGADSQYMGEMYYFGSVFAVMLVLALAALLSGRGSRPTIARNIWLVLALLILILTLGGDGGLWPLMSHLPVLNLVNHYPYRLLPFFNIFAIVGGCLAAVRVGRGLKRQKAWELSVTILCVLLLGWHLWFARSSFYNYGFKPNALLDPQIARFLASAGGEHPAARVMPWAARRSPLPEFRNSEMLNLPMQDGLCSFMGYDPLTESREPWLTAASNLINNPVEACRRYGIRWQIVSERLIYNPVLTTEAEGFLEKSTALSQAGDRLVPALEQAENRKALKLPGLFVSDLAPVDPLAFFESRPGAALALTTSNAGVDVDIPAGASGSNVVVNWLWYPQMRADFNGAAITCDRDPYGRILAAVPASPGVLHIRYCPDWSTGLLMGAILAAAALLGCVGLSFYRTPIEAVTSRFDQRWLGFSATASAPGKPARRAAPGRSSPAPGRSA